MPFVKQEQVEPEIQTIREWSPRSLMLFYEAIFQDEGWTVPAHLMPVIYALCDIRINNLLLVVAPGAGKSQLLSIVFPAWVIGHSARESMLGISAGEKLMQGFQSSVARIIEQDKVYQTAFPDVKADKDAGWSTRTGLFVSGHPAGKPDPNYLACGLTSSYLTGKHGSYLLVDDIHDEENASTAEACRKITESYTKTILGRAEPSGCRMIFAGRRWHTEDLYGVLMKSPEFVSMVLPASNPRPDKLVGYHVRVPEKLECVFTDFMCESPDGRMFDVRTMEFVDEQ